MERVPYALSYYGEREIKAVMEVLESGNTMLGKNAHDLEANIAREFGHDYGVMCNSGSSALTLAISAMDLPVGSEVITPALTFSTTVATQIQAGLVPVLVDSDIQTLNINIDLIENAITKKTRAMIIPDLMGNFSDWDRIREIADKYGLLTLHDSADTIGQRLRGKPVGARADISTTSLYGAHIINGAGNGGMVTTSNRDFMRQVRKVRSWGRESALFGESENVDLRFDTMIDHIEYDNKFVFSSLGYNLEGSEISAAFANVQYSRLDEFKARRRAVYDAHIEFLSEYSEQVILPTELDEAEVVWYAFPIILKENAAIGRKDLQVYLENKNIQTRPVFAGNIARQPGFKDKNFRIAGSLENADYVMKNALVIGCHQGMSDDQVNWVHECLREVFK